MSDVSIRAEGLSKHYRIAETCYRHDTLRDQLVDGLRGLFRRASRQTARTRPSTFWALQDVSFDVQAGEVLGVIGHNGAGKSTLLKILSRITEPTRGAARIYGRVGSLLEVGTGFAWELSGRENIYLSGAILGMRKAEIDRKFDDIVAFAEVDKFIDTPVKRYSSGMFVRLAFAVAAHLEPEILLVDEVLAVGDAAFQKKCLGKMNDVARQGRTVLFVSHNMAAITRLCTRCLWLNEGQVAQIGEPSETVRAYLKHRSTDLGERRWLPARAPGDEAMRLLGVRICQPPGVAASTVDITAPFDIEIETDVENPPQEMTAGVKVLTGDGQTVLHTTSIMTAERPADRPGRWLWACRLPAYALNASTYYLTVGADVPHVRTIFLEESVLSWTVDAVSPQMGRYGPGAWSGVIGPGLARWEVREVGA